MANSAKEAKVGWELIWRRGNDLPRYGSAAAPDLAVIEWAKAIPERGFILDVGCGAGRHMVYLGGHGFRMAGVDISPSGIRLSREACAERQIAFEGQVSDMNALLWADDTFDAALSMSAIHHHRREAIERTLGEVRRVLKPGGLLLVDFPCTLTLDYRQLRSLVAAGQISEVEHNTFVDERPDIDDMDDGFLPHHYCDEADLRDLLHSFEIVRLCASLHESKDGAGMRGKWIAWARKPWSDES